MGTPRREAEELVCGRAGTPPCWGSWLGMAPREPPWMEAAPEPVPSMVLPRVKPAALLLYFCFSNCYFNGHVYAKSVAQLHFPDGAFGQAQGTTTVVIKSSEWVWPFQKGPPAWLGTPWGSLFGGYPTTCSLRQMSRPSLTAQT